MADNKKTYNVEITETLRKVVQIEAESAEEARQIVSERWKASEYVLYPEDFENVEFHTLTKEEVGKRC